MRAGASPSLNVACTTPASITATSPTPSSRFVPLDPLLDAALEHEDDLFLSRMRVEGVRPCRD